MTEPSERALAYLRAKLDPEMDLEARKAVYAALRASVQDETTGRPAANTLAARLAVEHAIQAAETRLASRNAATAPTPDVDVWGLLTEGTEADPARDSMHFSAAAQSLLQGGVARRRWRTGGVFQRARMILSLWLHGLNREASMDRIGYVWLIVDPLLQIVVICAVPFFLHAEVIYDMPTLPFSIIGACFWLVFRVSAFGAISGGGVLKPQLEHPVIRRFDIIVARSLNALINFMVAGAALLGITALYGMTEWPQNLPLFLLFFATSWIMGLCYGIVLNSLIERYPALLRINAYSMRFIGLMSALFYVPEQLPDAILRVILYNPLLHIVQSARTYWFHSYEADYLSPTYILFWVLVLAVLALVCLIIDERRPMTVRV